MFSPDRIAFSNVLWLCCCILLFLDSGFYFPSSPLFVNILTIFLSFRNWQFAYFLPVFHCFLYIFSPLQSVLIQFAK